MGSIHGLVPEVEAADGLAVLVLNGVIEQATSDGLHLAVVGEIDTEYGPVGALFGVMDHFALAGEIGGHQILREGMGAGTVQTHRQHSNKKFTIV